MKRKEIQTKYGVIWGRDALIISGVKLECYPFNLTVHTSLSLSCCRPKVLNAPEVEVTFVFSDIKNLSIYELEEYPYGDHSQSCFDYVEETHEDGRQHVILQTYDHVFDVIGKYEIVICPR